MAVTAGTGYLPKMSQSPGAIAPMRTRRGKPVKARQVKGSIAKTVLSYVRRGLGEEGVRRVLESAENRLGSTDLSEPASWMSVDATLAIAEAAAGVCGDPDIGRRAGEELMRISRERGTVDFVRAAGSVAAALELAANAATRMSDGRTFEILEAGDGHAVMVGTYVSAASAHPFFCAHTAGYFGLLPEVFGCTGIAVEPECMGRGDARCLYRIAWSRPLAPSDESDAAATAASRERADSFVTRFEQLHMMATELAGAEHVDTLLSRITERAGIAVDAHRYLLVVQGRSDGRVRIHHRGFDATAATRFAERLLSGDLREDERTIVADVVSGDHVYGRLAAISPRGSSVTAMDRRLLAAYARHAAAALDAVASLEAARRDRDTAEALLQLAHELARASSPAEVARRVADAIPRITGTDRVGVWLWDEPVGTLRLEAQYPAIAALAAPPVVLRAGRIAELARLADRPEPMAVDLDDASGPIRALMVAARLARCIVVPVVARGQFLGVLTAGFAAGDTTEWSTQQEEDLCARLGGLADQAATALDNVVLLARIQHQALHDPLTGLPNRIVLEDRTRQALLKASRSGHSCALLFLDLDCFKNVNDTLGHDVGDDLIAQVADRLRLSLRAADTLARFGGDEFVVLLSDPDSVAAAPVVAEKVLAALRTPFLLAGDQHVVSCSIGIACAPEDGDDYDTLLRHADAAMYRAKHTAGARYVRFGEPELSSAPQAS